jgi:hypothetical protein
MTKEESEQWFKEIKTYCIQIQDTIGGHVHDNYHRFVMIESMYQAFKSRMLAEIRDAEEKEGL